MIRRLTYDRRYFARPARTLFAEVRMHFAIGDQLRVWTVIDRNINLALEFLERTPEGALDGTAAQCRAHTRKGTPCQREPLPARDYCPRTSTSRRRSTVPRSPSATRSEEVGAAA